MDWSNLQADYERLGNQRAVAEEYGCAQQTVSKHMRRQGIILPTTTTGRKFVWTDERRANHKAATNTPTFKEAHRVSLLNRFDMLRGNATNSPLESLLHAALNRAGVSFTTQRKKLGKYVVDIEVIQKLVIIEADGLRHRLERQQALDVMRDTELAEIGYQVFRFSGTEINADADVCVRLVMDKAELTPDIDPIADIRRAGSGEDNPNWRGGKNHYFCDFCGSDFEAYASCRTSDRTFCNQECWFAFRKDRANNR